MSTFYMPVVLEVKSVPLIVYPMLGAEKILDRHEAGVLKKYCLSLYKKNSELVCGVYHIVILWSDSGILMTDVWLFSDLESAETGLVVDCRTYKGTKLVTGNGISASDGLIMLGRESELEESMRKNGQSVSEYISGPRPKLPGLLNPTDGFYR